MEESVLLINAEVGSDAKDGSVPDNAGTNFSHNGSGHKFVVNYLGPVLIEDNSEAQSVENIEDSVSLSMLTISKEALLENGPPAHSLPESPIKCKTDMSE